MTDIQELFARDPLKLTREDRTEIITHLRQLRHNYTAKPAAAPKVKAAKNPVMEVDLGLLGL